jgi:broad-specificity NMP kinase
MKNTLPKDLFKNGFAIKENNKNEPIDILSLEAIRKFIRDNFRKNKTINIKIGSYKLKHIAERNIKNIEGYVCNGDFIASMILEGYEYKKDYKNSPNAYFNLSQISIRKFLK